MKKKIGIGFLILVVVIQFFRIDKTNPVIIEGNDIISLFTTIIIAGLTYVLLDFFGDKNSSFIALTKLSNFYIIKRK
jgi:hypothetical protein